jgi:mRNA-degrading endonuclease RelE of RelBE toxin-antitoxin system
LTYQVRLHTEAQKDLAWIKQDDPEGFARLVVFFQEYLTQDNRINNLESDDFSDDVMSVGKIREYQKRAVDIRRIKLQGLDVELISKNGANQADEHFLAYRLLYAFDDAKEVVWILGVFHRRDFNYDPAEQNFIRVKNTYDALGLARRKYIH